MPVFSAHLSRLFTERPFPDRFGAAREAGFTAVEYVSPGGTPQAAVADRLAAHGLTLALFNAATGDMSRGERGLAAQPGREADYAAALDWAVAHATATGAQKVHLMAGNGDRTDARQRALYRDNVVRAAERLGPLSVTIVLEPINGRDFPGYFLSDFNFAADLIADIGLPNVRLLFDAYHRQIMHGDVVMGLRALWPLIGHVQIASVPSRQEPDTEEFRYEFLFEELDRLGYDGYVGAEYTPKAGTAEGLGWLAPYRR